MPAPVKKRKLVALGATKKPTSLHTIVPMDVSPLKDDEAFQLGGFSLPPITEDVTLLLAAGGSDPAIDHSIGAILPSLPSSFAIDKKTSLFGKMESFNSQVLVSQASTRSGLTGTYSATACESTVPRDPLVQCPPAKGTSNSYPSFANLKGVCSKMILQVSNPERTTGLASISKFHPVFNKFKFYSFTHTTDVKRCIQALESFALNCVEQWPSCDERTPWGYIEIPVVGDCSDAVVVDMVDGELIVTTSFGTVASLGEFGLEQVEEIVFNNLDKDVPGSISDEEEPGGLNSNRRSVFTVRGGADQIFGYFDYMQNRILAQDTANKGSKAPVIYSNVSFLHAIECRPVVTVSSSTSSDTIVQVEGVICPLGTAEMMGKLVTRTFNCRHALGSLSAVVQPGIFEFLNGANLKGERSVHLELRASDNEPASSLYQLTR